MNYKTNKYELDGKINNIEPIELSNDNTLSLDIQEVLPSIEHPLIKSINTLSEQGNIAKRNEDNLYADADRGIVGVFDGASDVVGFKSPEGLTGGALASMIAVDTLSQSDPNQSLLDIIIEANNKIDAIQREFDLDPRKKEARFCTTAALARVYENESGERLIDLLQVADSVAVVVYENGKVEVPLGLYDHDEETMQLWKTMVEEGMTGAEILQTERMKNQIKSKRSESNVTYGVLNGENEVADFIKQDTISADGVSKVILLSDGLFLPKSNPTDSDNWEDIVRVEESGGVRAILEYIRDIENTDPDCMLYPRFKIHDDATAAVINIK